MSGSDSGTARNPLTTALRTALAGFPLQNATPNILQWASPNDGQTHLALIAATLIVTSAETGGGVILRWTIGGVAVAAQMMNASLAVNTSFTDNIVCDPNTTVTVAQQSALTLGASTLFASIAGG